MNSIEEVKALLIRNIESKSFKCIQNLASDIPAGDAKDNAEYMLGYMDGVSDLCDTLKETIYDWIKRAKDM